MILFGLLLSIAPKTKGARSSQKFSKTRTFINQVNDFISACKNNRPDHLWVDNTFHKEIFVQKLIVPSNAHILFFADIHGDPGPLEDLLIKLQNEGWADPKNKYKLIKKNGKALYLVGLGDYIDRGKKGVKTLTILMKLYRQNPSQVVLLRGNHETEWIPERYGFAKELISEWSLKTWPQRNQVYKLFDFLPSACVILWESQKTKKGIFCTHGGFEEKYKLKKLLKNQNKLFQFVPINTKNFIWSDLLPPATVQFRPRKSGQVFTKIEAENYLNIGIPNLELLGIIRGHQQVSLQKNLKLGNVVDIYDSKKQWDAKSTEPLFLKNLITKKKRNLIEIFLNEPFITPFILTLDFFRYQKYPRLTWPNSKAPILTLELDPNFEKCKFTREWLQKK